MKQEEFLFDNLFKKALSDWPASLTLELQTQKFEEIHPTDKRHFLVRYKNLEWDKKFENYIINGLYDLCEKIEEKYYNHPEEVIMRGLHTSIGEVIRDLAQYLIYIELKYLRPEMVQKKFESIRKEALDNPEEYKYLNWEEKDFRLVKDYFFVNYPDHKPDQG